MNTQSRRRFLQHTALWTGATAFTGPLIRSVRAGEPGANDKIHVGLIGAGTMGRGDLECFLDFPDVECVAIADVDGSMLAQGLETCTRKGRKAPAGYKDFRHLLDRKDVDAVIVATPDHWHAIPTIMACQAGKDVYVEKPLATTIAEGRAMVRAAQKHQRVVQMGSQWRSCPHMLEAAELVKSGKLGRITLARAWANLDWMPRCAPQPDGMAPESCDYNFWLGPAPARPFNPNRFHFNFRWYWDYGGGLMTDWGVHLLNMIFMGLPLAWPQSVASSGANHPLGDAWETPGSQTTVYEFENYNVIYDHLAGYATTINNHPWGIAWYGSNGILMMNDAGWEIVPERRLANLDPEKRQDRRNPRPAHIRNFLDCIKSRQSPALNLELGHHLTTLAHLGNIAYRTRAKVAWNAEKEEVVGNSAANQLVSPTYRKPWQLDYSPRD